MSFMPPLLSLDQQLKRRIRIQHLPRSVKGQPVSMPPEGGLAIQGKEDDTDDPLIL
jgi:hypothetical protein